MDIVVLKSSSQALTAAQALGLSLQENPISYYLNFENNQWVVRNPKLGKNFVIRWDFKAEYQRLYSQKIKPKKDLLCRALGFKGQSHFWLVDGTLGAARDALHLLSCGAHVIGAEKNPLTYFLLKSAWQHSTSLHDRFAIFQGAIEDHLPLWIEQSKTLYLDPMFENTQQKRVPKKNLAFLRQISPPEDNMQRVIERALHIGFKRVVVKRPVKGGQFYDKPNMVLDGKLVGYHVYI